MTMTRQDIVSKWKRADARERQSVQELAHRCLYETASAAMVGIPICPMKRFWRSWLY
jgi:hypothetical protein